MMLRSMLVAAAIVSASSAFADDAAWEVLNANTRILEISEQMSQTKSIVYEYSQSYYNDNISHAQRKADVNGSFFLNLVHGNVYSRHGVGMPTSEKQALEKVNALTLEWVTQIDLLFDKTQDANKWALNEITRIDDMLMHKQLQFTQADAYENSIVRINGEARTKALNSVSYFFSGDKVMRNLFTHIDDSASRKYKNELNELKAVRQSIMDAVSAKTLDKDFIIKQREKLKMKSVLAAPLCGGAFII